MSFQTAMQACEPKSRGWPVLVPSDSLAKSPGEPMTVSLPEHRPLPTLASPPLSTSQPLRLEFLQTPPAQTPSVPPWRAQAQPGATAPIETGADFDVCHNQFNAAMAIAEQAALSPFELAEVGVSPFNAAIAIAEQAFLSPFELAEVGVSPTEDANADSCSSNEASEVLADFFTHRMPWNHAGQ